ncbi:MAG: hypothetical protein M3Q54_08240 [Actinomycetota bacterium]|nr:hypothetical protein [Actinomycetota bacterium]
MKYDVIVAGLGGTGSAAAHQLPRRGSAGFAGHGYKFASVADGVLANFVSEGCTRHFTGPFSPARFSGVSK